MERFQVQFRAYKTGKWYTKTETDSKPAAFSVAKIGNFGRACRVIDGETGEVIFETGEDVEMAKVKGKVF